MPNRTETVCREAISSLAREVLAELGFADAEVAALHERGVLR